MAQLSRGVNQHLVILERWHTSRGFSYSWSGTLFHGVNLLMRSGAMERSKVEP